MKIKESGALILVSLIFDINLHYLRHCKISMIFIMIAK